MDLMSKSKINNLMATFKNFEHNEFEQNDLGDHLEKEFLDIIHLFTNERKAKMRLLNRL